MSEIRRLREADRSAVEAFLDRHRASSMFLRSNLHHAGFADGPERYQGLYVGAFDDDVLTAVAAHYWNGTIILQAPEHPLELALAAVQASGRVVEGVIGPWDQVQAVEGEVGLDRSRLNKVVPEALYTLPLRNLQVPGGLTSGAVMVRSARETDLDLLTVWRRIYDRITLGFPEAAISDANNRAMLAGAIADDRLWVLEDGGAAVCMTGFNATLPDIVQIGGVFTPEDRRGRGYARAAVAGSLIQAQKTGVTDAILFTEMDNIPAQKAYEALGFERTGEYGMVLLDPA